MRLVSFFCLVLSLVTLSSCKDFQSESLKSVPAAAPLDYDSSSALLNINGGVAKQVVLSNGLKVILISSPTSQKAAAAVGARVGHRDNPMDRQGLAHFLEHMLFLGTKEFPVVGEYSQYLKSNGGDSNAYTSGDHTNYYLEIQSENFEDALNRLSRFFVSPLFDENYLEREKNAVHNEYNMRFQPFRSYRPPVAFLQENDSDRQFAVGNNITLKDATVEDTRQLFEDYYYAEAMHAVLAGPQDLNTLEQWAEKYFSDIQSKKDQTPKVYNPLKLWDESKLPAQVNFKSSGDERVLSLTIPIKNAKEENLKLLSAIGVLLGDESETSLMVSLQKHGWVKPGEHMLNGGAAHSELSLAIQLTEKGFLEYGEVLNFIKGYLFQMKAELPSYINQELKSFEAIRSQSKEFYEINAELIQGINGSYFYNDWLPKNWHELFLGRIDKDINAKEYQDYLSRINWDKVLVQLTHPSLPDVPVDLDSYMNIDKGGLAVETVNGQKLVVDYLYKFAAPVLPLDPKSIQEKGQFTLKEQNNYLPQSFEIYPDENIGVYSIKSGSWGEIRFNQTPEVSSAKTYMSLNVHSSGVNFNDAKDTVGLFLYREWIRNKTASSSYAMKEAGFDISYPIYLDKGALSINIAGWSDSFLNVVEDTLNSFAFSMSDSDFSNLKAAYKDKLQQERAGSIDAVSSRAVLSMITPINLDYEILNKVLDEMSPNDFRDFVSRYYSAVHLRGVLTGNIQSQQVDDVITYFSKNLSPTWNLEPVKLVSPIDVTSSDGISTLNEKMIESPDKMNSLYLGFWDLGSNLGRKEQWISKIFGELIYPDYYEELRTNKQLAYSLYATRSKLMKHEFLNVYLQSSTHSADEIQSEVDGFIYGWVKNELPLKTEAAIQATIDNLIAENAFPKDPKALHVLVSKLNDEDLKTLGEIEDAKKILKSITLADVVNFAEMNFLLCPKRGAFVKVNKKL